MRIHVQRIYSVAKSYYCFLRAHDHRRKQVHVLWCDENLRGIHIYIKVNTFSTIQIDHLQNNINLLLFTVISKCAE